MWIDGVLHKRRPDTIGFVNGLPLLFAEWKAPTCPIADAHENNLRDYRDTIPQLFSTNSLEAVMGPSHAPFDAFAPWKRLEEGGPEDPSLETMLRATCEPSRFLDLVENFLLFDEARGGLRKVVGKYHQVLGVNRAIEAVQHISENKGRLGVFWHTQGSGKSLSMVMFAEKVLRRLGGNYTFVIVTDRTELDDQIAGHLQKALAVYAGGGGDEGKKPIEDKGALVTALEDALGAVNSFVRPYGVDPDAIMAVKGFERLKLISQGVEAVVAPDDRRREFLRLAGAVTRAYKALLPDDRAAPYLQPVAVFHMLSDAVRAKLGPVDISAVAARIAELLDEKIEGVAILTPLVEGNAAEGRVDLSGIDFEKLADLFAISPKVAAQRLKDEAEEKARSMAEKNPTRVQLVEKLEKLVAEYNAGSIDAQRLFEALMEFINGLDAEEQRAAREGLTEDELAIFDLLTTPEPKLTLAEEQEVKRVARQLLDRLRELVGAIDWVRGQETRGAVLSEIRVRLNELPEQPYPQVLWDTKVDQVWDFVLRRYS